MIADAGWELLRITQDGRVMGGEDLFYFFVILFVGIWIVRLLSK